MTIDKNHKIGDSIGDSRHLKFHDHMLHVLAIPPRISLFLATYMNEVLQFVTILVDVLWIATDLRLPLPVQLQSHDGPS